MKKLHSPPEPRFKRRLERRADLRVLRENERAFAGCEHALDEFREPRELSAGRSVADELEACDQREDVALPPVASPEVGKRGLVLGALLRRERTVLAYLALRAQLARYALVALQAAQHERLERMAQTLGRSAVRLVGYRLYEAFGEALPVAEETGVQILLEAPHVSRRILDGRTRERDAALHSQRADRPRRLRIGVLYGLRLVQHKRTPLHLADVAVVLHEKRVARHDHVRLVGRTAEADVLHASVALMHMHLQRGRELRELVAPVCEQRERRYDQSRPCGAALRENPPDRLYRLAEAHVVRKQRPEAIVRQELQPRDAATLIVAKRSRKPVQPRWILFKQRGAACGAKLVHEPAKPSVGSDALHLEAADAPDAARERNRLGAGERGDAAALERAKGLLQDVAVYVYPASAKEYERRALVEQKAYLLRTDLLARDVDLEPRLYVALPRLVAALGIDLRGRRDGRRDIHPRYGVAGFDKFARAAHNERLGLAVGKLGPKRAALRPQLAQRTEHIGRLTERPKRPSALRRFAAYEECLLLGLEAEAYRPSYGSVGLAAAMPLGQIARKCLTLAVVPAHKPRLAAKRHHPCVMQRLVLLVLGVARKRSLHRRPYILVYPRIPVVAERTPSGVPSVVLPYEVGIEASVGDQL